MGQFDFKDAMIHGLRQRVGLTRNGAALKQCINLKPTQDGLIPIEAITKAFQTAGLSADFPFPQIFYGAGVIFACTRSAIYLVGGFPSSITFSNITSFFEPFENADLVADHALAHLATLWTDVAGHYTQLTAGGFRKSAGAGSSMENLTQTMAAAFSHSKTYHYYISGKVLTGSPTITAEFGNSSSQVVQAVTNDSYLGGFVISGTINPTTGAGLTDQFKIGGTASTTFDLYEVRVREAVAVSATRPWRFMDFGAAWCFIGDQMLILRQDYSATIPYSRHASSLSGSSDSTGFRGLVSASYRAIDGVCFRGRALFANLADSFPSWLSNSSRYPIPTEIAQTLPFRSFTARTLWWSSILAGDRFMFWQEAESNEGYLDFGDNTAFSPTTTLELRLQMLNERGWKDLKDIGDLVGLAATNEHIYAFGDSGVYQLTPMSSPVGQFSFRRVYSVGLPYIGASIGTESYVLFIDAEGCLVRIDAQGVTRLRYEEFFAPLVGRAITMSHDPAHNDIYITGSLSDTTKKCYALSESGLYELRGRRWSVACRNGVLYGIAETATATYSLRTEEADFGNRGVKTLKQLELGLTSSAAVTATVYSNYGKGATPNKVGAVSLGYNAKARMVGSGVEFELEVSGADYATVSKINYGIMNFDETGKRRTSDLIKKV